MNNLERMIKAVGEKNPKAFEIHFHDELSNRIADRINEKKDIQAAELNEFGQEQPVLQLPNWEGREVTVFQHDKKHGRNAGKTLMGTISRVIRRDLGFSDGIGWPDRYGPFYCKVDVDGREITAIVSERAPQESDGGTLYGETFPGIKES